MVRRGWVRFIRRQQPVPVSTLNRALLAAARPLPSGVACGPLATFPERIVQFGEGEFLRAFADWMIDELNGRGLLGSQVLVVQPVREGLAGVLNSQDGLYTVLARGTESGRPVEEPRVVTAVSRALDPYAQWFDLVATFTGPDLRFVISNTTEAGAAFALEPFDPARCPESFAAKIATLLHARYQAVRGHPERGLVFLPCEPGERNGAFLRDRVLRHLAAWGLPAACTRWVEDANLFLNTLVDRLVPGYPQPEAAALAARLAYDDRLLVAAERFHEWVIEGPREIEAELPFARAGLNVIWTEDLAPYRQRQLRVLQGGRTGALPAAFCAGADTVCGMMEDPITGAFARHLVMDEILPRLAQPEAERRAYATVVLERFRNPFVRQELLALAPPAVAQWRRQVLPSLLDATAATGRPPPLLTFSLAALLWFYRGETHPDGTRHGLRQGERYAIHDEPAVLEGFARAWARARADRDWTALAAPILARRDFWGRDLNAVRGLTGCVVDHLGSIATYGMRESVALARARLEGA